MLRLFSTAAPLRALTARSVAAPALRLASSTLQRAAGVRAATAVRRFSSNAEEEEGEERAPLVVKDTVPALKSSLATLPGVDAELQQWLDEYKQQSNFEVTTNPESLGVLMQRKADGFTVRVAFRADDIMQNEDAEEEPEPQQQEGEEAQEHVEELAFNVDIINDRSGAILRVECSNAKDGELVLENISFPAQVTSDPTTTPRSATSDGVDKDATPDYETLDFSELPEEASERMLDFLESVAVDDDLASFVPHQAEAVRQAKVQQQCEKLRKFLQ